MIDFADHHSGTVATHPDRSIRTGLGFELWKDIEDRWNKGKFGKDYDECDSIEEKQDWDKSLGLGREKIFETRQNPQRHDVHRRVLTEEFCRDTEDVCLSVQSGTRRLRDRGREFKKVKQKLLFSLTNFGQPFIYVREANYENRGELYLEHRHEGIDLRMDYAKATTGEHSEDLVAACLSGNGCGRAWEAFEV